MDRSGRTSTDRLRVDPLRCGCPANRRLILDAIGRRGAALRLDPVRLAVVGVLLEDDGGAEVVRDQVVADRVEVEAPRAAGTCLEIERLGSAAAQRQRG